MKKEIITICAGDPLEAQEIRENFNNTQYKLNIIICGTENPVEFLGTFLLGKIN